MSAILSITLPIYAVIAVGYVVVARGWFDQADMRTMGRYVLNIALPALLFNAVASRDVAQVIQPGYMLVFLAGGLATIAATWGWFRLRGENAARRAIAVMGASCPNSGFIGYPVMLLVFPDIAGVILALNMLVENVILIPICLILLDLARPRQDRSVMRLAGGILLGVMRRPMIIGLALGLVVSLSGLTMPEPVTTLFQMIAASAAALSLIVIGGSLVGLPLSANKGFAGQIALAKLLLHPALVAGALVLLTSLGLVMLEPHWATAVILSAAMPMFGIYTVFAQEHGLEGVASLAMLVTTSAGFLTLTALLLFLT